MPLCDRCKTWSPDGSPICHKCNFQILRADDESAKSDISSSSGLRNTQGNGVSLTVAYWVYFVLGGVLVGISSGIVFDRIDESYYRVVMVIVAGYSLWAFWMVLSASRRTGGVWSFLASLHAVLATAAGIILMFILDHSLRGQSIGPVQSGRDLGELVEDGEVGVDWSEYDQMVRGVEDHVSSLNPSSPEFDQSQVDRIEARVDSYLQRGFRPVDSLQRAVFDVTGIDVSHYSRRFSPDRGAPPDRSRRPGSSVSIPPAKDYSISSSPKAAGGADLTDERPSLEVPKISYGTPHRLPSWSEMKEAQQAEE